MQLSANQEKKKKNSKQWDKDPLLLGGVPRSVDGALTNTRFESQTGHLPNVIPLSRLTVLTAVKTPKKYHTKIK